MVAIFNSKTHKTGICVYLTFILSQHTQDKQLLLNLKDYFGCGRYKEKTESMVGEFIVTKFSDLTDRIIPFFERNLILGAKYSDFADFCKVAELMKKKVHLTEEGLKEIKKIKSNMNTGRKPN